jgi:SpoVK/Ycf46/Vps4 family AAA+-type ATPase
MGQGDLLRELTGDLPQEADGRLLPAAAQRRANTARSTQRLRALPEDRVASELMVTRDPQIGFDDLLLPEETRRLFAEVHLELRREDFLVHHGVAPRRTFLFIGPPGTGKSATAEAVADELGRPLATVNLSTVVSSLLGDTARNLAAIFATAARDSYVVLFDEFDAIGKERAEGSDHGELRRVVTAFLQQLDGFFGPSLLIAATNHPALLDLAAWRRFDEVIAFQLPHVHDIRALLRLKLRSVKRERGLNIDQVAGACRGLTQADVSTVVIDAYRRHLLMEPDQPLRADELLAAAAAAQRRTAAARAGS